MISPPVTADEMGLGKTVECLSACVLRNLAARKNGKASKTVIVTPNEAVSEQVRVRVQYSASQSIEVHPGKDLISMCAARVKHVHRNTCARTHTHTHMRVQCQ